MLQAAAVLADFVLGVLFALGAFGLCALGECLTSLIPAKIHIALMFIEVILALASVFVVGRLMREWMQRDQSNG